MRIDGNTITLDGDELAIAVDAYLAAHRIHVTGPRTIRYRTRGAHDLALGEAAQVYVDPSGRVVDNRDAPTAAERRLEDHDRDCETCNPDVPPGPNAAFARAVLIADCTVRRALRRAVMDEWLDRRPR